MIAALDDFEDASREWRRLFSELLGTFFLVLVAAGGGMMGQAFPDTISRTAEVVAPGLMVTAIIMFMGKVSGAHLNPGGECRLLVTRRLPMAARAWVRRRAADRRDARGLFLHAVIDVSASYGSNYPAAGYSALDAFLMEAVLTLGLAQRHPRDRIWRAEHRHLRRDRRRCIHRSRRIVGKPDLGSVDEPGAHIRSRPCRTDFTSYWVYLAGPLIGALLQSAQLGFSAGRWRPRCLRRGPGQSAPEVKIRTSREVPIATLGRSPRAPLEPSARLAFAGRRDGYRPTTIGGGEECHHVV